MCPMVRTPILLAILAYAAPASAASGDGRGWRLDTGGALSVASLAYRAIDRGDVAAITDNKQGPRVSDAVDPSRIGLATIETGDRRSPDAIARVSARFSF